MWQFQFQVQYGMDVNRFCIMQNARCHHGVERFNLNGVCPPYSQMITVVWKNSIFGIKARTEEYDEDSMNLFQQGSNKSLAS